MVVMIIGIIFGGILLMSVGSEVVVLVLMSEMGFVLFVVGGVLVVGVG